MNKEKKTLTHIFFRVYWKRFEKVKANKTAEIPKRGHETYLLNCLWKLNAILKLDLEVQRVKRKKRVWNNINVHKKFERKQIESDRDRDREEKKKRERWKHNKAYREY